MRCSISITSLSFTFSVCATWAISVGVSAAFLWSLWALFFTEAGMPGMKMEFTLLPKADEGGAAEIYLEVATAVTVFIILGRYLEARAKKSSGAALRALLDMGAKDVAVLRDGLEIRVPVAQLKVGDTFVVHMDREALNTTGIGNGIALPHAKTDAVTDMMLGLGIMREPIDFHSIDDAPYWDESACYLFTRAQAGVCRKLADGCAAR